MPGMDDRVTVVEEKLAHLEKYVSELDGVVREMHDQIAALKREVGRMQDRIEQAQEGEDPDDLEANRPPHY